MKLRDFGNTEEQKQWIYDSIKSAFDGKQYVGKNYILEIKNPKIIKRDYSIEDQKKALLSNRTLSEPIKADVFLKDKEGHIVEEKKDYHIASMPYHTGRGDVISNGAMLSMPANQLRLRPGVYVRKRVNGEIEAHYNLRSGTGSGFRVEINPQSGLFNLRLGTLNAPLYPFMKALGVSDTKLESVWGPKLLEINKAKDVPITKFYDKLIMFKTPNATDEDKVKEIVKVFHNAKMDKDVNMATLKKPYDTVTGDVILDSTKHILAVSKGEEEDIYRDSMLFKTIHSAEDFYNEKITKDAGKLGQSLISRIERKKSLSPFIPGYFTKQLWGVIKSNPTVSPQGTLSQPLEEINPIDMYDQLHKVTILGEGGIGSIREVTLEARNVHPSEFGFIDNVRTPESFNVGIDKRTAYGTKKGSDNQLYKEFVNAKTGKKEWLNPLQVADNIIAFPGEWESSKKQVDAIQNGKQIQVDRKDIDYYLPTAFEQFSTYDNLVPMAQTIQGNRMILAGKALALTLPLKYGEAPLVQVLNTTKQLDAKNLAEGKPEYSWEKEVADKVVNKLAKVSGRVTKITPNNIFVKGVRHGLYNNFPLNLKTYISHIPTVKVGDVVQKGDLLAHSNFSDDKGVLSFGKNLRTAYMNFKGWTFEDGYPISESAAKKLSSEQMYTSEYDIDDPNSQVLNKERFQNMFPKLYPTALYDKYDEQGVIKPGSVVKYGEPLILAMEKRIPSARDIQMGNLHKNLKNQFRLSSVDWHHHTDGYITDASHTAKGVKVLVKTITPAQVGDKITGRFGNKGVIGLIIPDNEMPQIDGKPIDVIMNPVGIPSRINPGQLHEAMLGKIAAKIGKPFVVPPFRAKYHNVYKNVQDLLKKYDVKSEDTVTYQGKEIPNVFNGVSYIWKLSKMSEGELKKREIGGYDIDQQPIKGKSEQGQALKIGQMEINALLGHSAKATLRDMAIKGQRNDDFWRAVKLGYPLPPTPVPFVYNKFLTMLKGAGINTKREGDGLRLMPLVDKEILTASNGAIQNGNMVYAKNLEPVSGGLFDKGITGGVYGKHWNHIKLSEGIPNPVMEDSIKRILRIKGSEFSSMVSSNSLESALSKLDTKKEIEDSKELLKTVTGAKKDSELKRLGFLQNLERNNLQPKDLILHNVPVIPPIMRPISMVGSTKSLQSGNANLLYKDLIVADSALHNLKKDLPSDQLSNERQALYQAVKAVVGLDDPINLQNKNRGVTGFIETIVGENPKTGFFQKKVLSKNQDLVTRGVVSGDPTLSIDEIRLPKDSAWHIYKPFVMRNMILNGTPAVVAEQEIENQTDKAIMYLQKEMNERPVIMNRNPSLHKYNMMSFYPKLSTGNTIQVAAPITSSFAMDFDGDQANIFTPVTPEAVSEAKNKLLPSKNLLFIKDRDVHYTPSHGSLLGLYNLTKPVKINKPVKSYTSVADVKKDYLAGIVKPTDVIKLS